MPGGGASCLGVGRPGSGALPPPATRPFGRATGAHYPLADGAGGAGVATCHQPQSARSCELALRVVGAAGGRPGRVPLAWVWGVRGRALSQPRSLVRSGVRPGPTTHWLWARGSAGVGSRHQPHRARCCQLPLRAVRAARGCPGGGLLLPGRPLFGALQPPTARPSGRAAGSHYPLGVGAGGAGLGIRHQPHSARLCELALRAVGAAQGRPEPGCGASGVERSPTLDRLSFDA